MPRRIRRPRIAGLAALVIEEAAAQCAPQADRRNVGPLSGIGLVRVGLIFDGLLAHDRVVGDAREGQRLHGGREGRIENVDALIRAIGDRREACADRRVRAAVEIEDHVLIGVIKASRPLLAHPGRDDV